MIKVRKEKLIDFTVNIVCSYLDNNQISSCDIPELISKVYSVFAYLDSPATIRVVAQEPAVSIRNSVKPDYIVCLEDGKKLKLLKRHLRKAYDMSPNDYRAKWKLPSDYPMVAPNYADQRRRLAKKIGLGRKQAVASFVITEQTAVEPKKRSTRKLKLS